MHTFGNSDSKTKNIHLMIDSLINDETTVLGKCATILHNYIIFNVKREFLVSLNYFII